VAAIAPTPKTAGNPDRRAAELRLDVSPELTVQLVSREAAPELGLAPTKELLRRGAYFTALVCYDDFAAIVP